MTGTETGVTDRADVPDSTLPDSEQLRSSTASSVHVRGEAEDLLVVKQAQGSDFSPLTKYK